MPNTSYAEYMGAGEEQQSFAFASRAEAKAKATRNAAKRRRRRRANDTQASAVRGRVVSSRPRRSKAGRKAAEHRTGFEQHGTRPELDKNHPVHIVLRAKSGIPGFRQQRIFEAIRKRIEKATRDGFQVIHFSVQENHVHLIVEAMDRKLLWRGVQHLASRLAWAVNKILRRHGSLWRDRYTRRDLTNLRQVRNALVYVLMNVRKHTAGEKNRFLASIELDRYSSAAWFEGWDPRAGPMLMELWEMLIRRDQFERPVARPRTWFARTGWKRHGLVLPSEHPASSG
ncbi:hypothetical protein AKJ09_04953 [Labilithrix luteola]|uniref:Transposase IS200-like domain-containing protein n=1 Tax=Labilithrix luteola TaxID=1391654 RepID=A0A0K1PYS5_9BACT|nr:transposase [Labilithrix luteola]AKU98289.1 hypothetical protein AKJ09_04953 [Labilithrix luteola]